MMHWWNWGIGVGWLWMIVFWAIVIGVVAVIILVIVSLANKQSPTKGSPNLNKDKSVEILKERYARGEITREEYKQMLEDIKD